MDINGTTIAYVEKGSGPVVVLLHGFPLDGRMWAGQIEALAGAGAGVGAGRHRVIAMDLRGFGASKSADAFTMESLADDVHALAEKLGGRGIMPFVLAGLSMGGYVALAYVQKYPADLRGLILVDTKADADSAEGKRGRDQMIELVRKEGSKAVAEKMEPKMLAPGTLSGRPQIVKQLRGMMEACGAGTIEHALEAVRERKDATAALASIPVPTLIVVGEHDAITPPAVAEGMHKAIPRSELVVIKGAGHMSPLEQPEQVNHALRQFLGTLL